MPTKRQLHLNWQAEFERKYPEDKNLTRYAKGIVTRKKRIEKIKTILIKIKHSSF